MPEHTPLVGQSLSCASHHRSPDFLPFHITLDLGALRIRNHDHRFASLSSSSKTARISCDRS
ncbi:MAG: hypothetical protein KDE10_06660, partial [Rhodobacteraceae bacterium]|nr:hypothetical protein [Paracoccaceae bacterium]